MKLPYHLPLWFNPNFQCSQSFLHLLFAEINTAPQIYFFTHLFSCRRRCSWRNWGKKAKRNWQWIFHDEARSTGNELIWINSYIEMLLTPPVLNFFSWRVLCRLKWQWLWYFRRKVSGIIYTFLSGFHNSDWQLLDICRFSQGS